MMLVLGVFVLGVPESQLGLSQSFVYLCIMGNVLFVMRYRSDG